MRRSSWITLALATIILAAIGALFVTSAGSKAPPMTASIANDIIKRGTRALAAGDVEGIMDLIAPNARILDKSPDYMRAVLERTVKELGDTKLQIRCGPPTIKEQRGVAYVSFDMDVGERRGNVDIQYFHTRLDLQLKRVRAPRMMGAQWAEEWRIIRLDSSQSLDVPPL
jgi:hypothetical protein